MLMPEPMSLFLLILAVLLSNCCIKGLMSWATHKCSQINIDLSWVGSLGPVFAFQRITCGFLSLQYLELRCWESL